MYHIITKILEVNGKISPKRSNYNFLRSKITDPEMLKFVSRKEAEGYSVRELNALVKAGIEHPEPCKICGEKPRAFQFGANNSFSDYCSKSCSGKDLTRIRSAVQKRDSNEEANMARASRRKQTMLDKYGVEFNSQREAVKTILRQSKLLPSAKLLLEDRDWLYDQHFVQGKTYDQIAKEIGSDKNTVGGFIHSHDIPVKFGRSCSRGEADIAEFLKTLGVPVIRNDRKLIAPYELDILLPRHKLAIEFDGIYWHSSNEDETNNGHLEKTERVESKGYQLLHVFESEWEHKPEIVKSIIRNKLGLSEKIYARKCKLEKISSKEARDFFNATHLQGFTPASHYIGLKYENELVMCVSIGYSRFDKTYKWELIRVSSKLNSVIVGGFSKILSHIRSQITTEPILTYCDRKISTGGTYSQFGDLIRKTKPGYSWHSNSGWFTRYQTQKHKLEKLLPKHYHPDKTEREIMKSARYYQLFDCGNLVYVLK